MSIRVLVVDDSALMRRMIAQRLDAEGDIEVVGRARNGQHAISRVADLWPDVVIMDLEMPVMDGVDAVRALRVDHARLPIIMFSSHTDRGAQATMDALVAGATTYVSKNAGDKGVDHLISRILAPKIREVCGTGIVQPSAASRTHPDVRRSRTQVRRASTSQAIVDFDAVFEASLAQDRLGSGRTAVPKERGPVRCIGIGCSTGGPAALAEVLPGIPGDVGVPLLIVQHMPPRFTQLLADRLDKQCALRVVEGADGQEVVANTAYIAPGGSHMTVRNRAGKVVIVLDQEEPVNSCRPAVDRLFASLDQVYGGSTLAVIMTGMGQDGMHGCKALASSGASVITQDEDSCVVWGMPRAVVNAGLSDEELPIGRLSEGIVRHIWKRKLGRTA